MVLSNPGSGVDTFSETITYGAGATGWLTVTPASGLVAAIGSVTLTNTVNIAGLSAGTYYATNQVAASDATNSPQSYVIILSVNKADQTGLAFTPATPQIYNTTAGLAASGGQSSGGWTYTVQSGPGSITGTNLTLTSGTGTVIVRATKAGDANYNSAYVQTNVDAQKADQTISFTSIAQQVVTNTLVLAATATSAGVVSFSVAAGPASISGGTSLSFSSAGHVQVRATQSGDSNWNAAPNVTNAFTVIGVITNVTPPIGTVLGGTPVTISGLWLGNGVDITNVTICNVAATIVTQSQHSVTVTTGPSPVATNANVVLQSTGFGTVMLINGFTYHPLPLPPTALSAINVFSNRFRGCPRDC